MKQLKKWELDLLKIQNGVAEVYDSNSSLSEQHERDTIEMEAIRQANMKLFTQLGTEKTPVKQAEEKQVWNRNLLSVGSLRFIYDTKVTLSKH